MYDACRQAMAAGEGQLRTARNVSRSIAPCDSAFQRAGLAEHFPHHAGHGLGLTHPEAPFFVPNADETLLAGDVVTLEPGLYVEGVGGIRIENNYLITATGYERMSHHAIVLGR